MRGRSRRLRLAPCWSCERLALEPPPSRPRLTALAHVAAPPRHEHLDDLGAAAHARLPRAAVHQELVLEGPAQAIHVAEVIDARSARVDARAQRLDDPVAKARVLLCAETASRAQWVDPSAEQGLVGVDVPHACDLLLVQQKRLDRRPAAPRERTQVLGREALIERLEAEAGREERLERG